jgi:hypothetical protein
LTIYIYIIYIYIYRAYKAQTVDRTSPPTRCLPEPGEPAWRIPRAPPDHPIYRGCRPHGPTPPIYLLGFRDVDTDRVAPPPPDSTADRRPRPLTTDTKRSRTSIITGPSTWVTRSVCCASQIPHGADLSVTFVPRSTGRRPTVARPHTPP